MDESVLQLGVKPISSNAPAGESVRYEEEFEELQAEISKMESLNDESVDWTRVVDLGTQILSTMSKDLLVACYLCHGLYVVNDFQGLVAGMTILRDMVSTFWDELYPEKKRMRARISAVKWMVDHIAADMRDKSPGLDKHDAVTTSCNLADELEQLLDEKLGNQKPIGEQEPHWSELHRALRESEASISRAMAKLEQASATTAQPTSNEQNSSSVEIKPAESVIAAPSVPLNPSSSAAPAAPQEIVSDQDADRTLRACKDMLKKVASYQRERKLDDPNHYHLLRMAVWADIELPMMQNGITQVRQPAEEKVAKLNNLMLSGEYVELIREVESSFSAAPFWLSLHRYVASALEALDYSAAQRVVIDDLSVLLRRFPTLPECKFVSGETFADELTQEWIQASVLSGSMSRDVSSISLGSGVNSDIEGWQKTGREAKVLAVKGDIKQAVNLLKEGRKHAGTGREEFLWGLQEARFWQETGHVEIALPQLESLDEKVERFNLEQWEPELSFQIAELLLVWYKRMESKGSLSQERVARKERMHSRVSRLDAVRAMDILAKGK